MNQNGFTDQCKQHNISSCIIAIKGSEVLQYEAVKGASRELMPINSCTKSVVSALYCIGLGEGWLPAVETPVLSWFPELAQAGDPRAAEITVEHVLTLTAGFKWDEFGGNNNFPKMTRSENWLQYVADQPILHAPGTRWCYHSGVSQMLATLIVRASSRPLNELAEDKLFSPLHIQQYRWKTDPQGIHTGGYGMELTASDMLKVGQLFLQEGIWQGEPLIEKALCNEAVKPYIEVQYPEKGSYGWHWWCDQDTTSELSYFYARGYGGQFIIVVPAAEAVIVFTRQQRHKQRSPLELFREAILPMLSATID